MSGSQSRPCAVITLAAFPLEYEAGVEPIRTVLGVSSLFLPLALVVPFQNMRWGLLLPRLLRMHEYGTRRKRRRAVGSSKVRCQERQRMETRAARMKQDSIVYERDALYLS